MHRIEGQEFQQQPQTPRPEVLGCNTLRISILCELLGPELNIKSVRQLWELVRCFKPSDSSVINYTKLTLDMPLNSLDR